MPKPFMGGDRNATTSDGGFHIPNAHQLNGALPEWLAKIFREVDWPVPAYLKIGFLSLLAKAIESASPDVRPDFLREGLTAS